MISTLLLSALAVTTAVAKDIGTVGTITNQESMQKLASGSELFALYSEPAYVDPIYLVSLYGDTPYDQGYDAGVLVGKQFYDNYHNLLSGLFGPYPKLEPTLTKLTEEFLDWQWNDYLSKEVPQEYMDELSGLAAGSLATFGIADGDKMVARGIVLGNLPGDGADIIYVLMDEFLSQKAASPEGLTPAQRIAYGNVARGISAYNGHQCSNFGIWGSRTVNGDVFSARNLDWLPDLGVNQYKLLTVHHPKGGVPHVTVGFSAIWGSLAGMSAQGLTVHEANLEESQVTFRGFPWLLRLRHAMAYSPTGSLAEAKAIWEATNNTVGFNHMFGSAVDGKAMAMETQKDYSAYFFDMDDRENGAIDPETGEVYGFPLKDAVWRTNHGYDPVSQENYQWYTYHAYSNSKDRYNIIHDHIEEYETNKELIGATEAVRITSAVGMKGDGSNEEVCDPSLYAKGINVLSVTYDPVAKTIYAAFEDGSGDNWVPAACSPYVKIDMTPWF